MSHDNSVTFSDLEHYLPPDSARDYVSHDQYLRRKFGDAAVQSIRKEIEGMVRLYESVEGELDDDSREVLFEQLVKEIDALDNFEDEVASVGVRHFDK
jgi:Fe-S-cluster formation regulator IscX/YfhJ